MSLVICVLCIPAEFEKKSGINRELRETNDILGYSYEMKVINTDRHIAHRHEM